MAKTSSSSQRDPLRPLSQPSSTSRRRTHYRQATLSECLEALSSQPSQLSSDDPTPSSSVRSSKRVRLHGVESDASSHFEATSPPTTPASSPSKPPPRVKRHPKRSLVTQIESLALHGGSRAYRQARKYDAKGYLKTLVSDHVSDIAVIEDENQVGHQAPYTMALSQAAKRGERDGVLAVATNVGDITFFDPFDSAPRWRPEARPRILAHSNAIFTLSFSPSDSLLVSGGGDFACGVFSPSRGDCLAVLGGHKGSVRSVTFAPHDERMVVTGGRDGCIAMWDLRTMDATASHDIEIGAPRHAPSLLIRNAHDDLYAHRPGRRPLGASLPSIAGASILPSNPNHLVSSASGDGVVKLWDLRQAGKLGKAVHPKCRERSGLVGSLGGEEEEREGLAGSKGRGVSRMIVSPTGDRVYTLGMDSAIRAFDPTCLRRSSSQLPTYTSSTVVASSFYVPLALSPDERFISCGSVDGHVHIWDVQAPPSAWEDSVKVKAHEGEVAGLEWGREGLFTAGDDLTVRRWRFDRQVVGEDGRPGEGWTGVL